MQKLGGATVCHRPISIQKAADYTEKGSLRKSRFLNMNLKALTSLGIRVLFGRYMLKSSAKTQLFYALPIYHTVETIKHTIVILKLPLQSVQFFCGFCQLDKEMYLNTLNCLIDFGTKCSDAVFGKGLFYR